MKNSIKDAEDRIIDACSQGYEPDHEDLAIVDEARDKEYNSAEGRRWRAQQAKKAVK